MNHVVYSGKFRGMRELALFAGAGGANRVDRIKAIGNGQVPLVAARSFCELIEVLEEP